MYVELLAVKQVHGDKSCLGFSASMAFNESIEQWENFLKNASPLFDQIRVDPPWGLAELKIYALAHQKDIVVTKDDLYGQNGPAVIVVHSEHYKDVLHAIFMDEKGFIHDPNPDTNDGRNILSYKVVEWYKIVPFLDD